MLQRLGIGVSLVLLGAVSPIWAQAPPAAPMRTARTVVYHARDLVALRARVHYTTLIVLPDGESVVEATCGDKEVWIVNVRDGLVSVKPAKTGAETNLNLITTSGQVYAFLLSEVSETKGVEPDLTVYLDRDDTEPRCKIGVHLGSSFFVPITIAGGEIAPKTATSRTRIDVIPFTGPCQDSGKDTDACGSPAASAAQTSMM